MRKESLWIIIITVVAVVVSVFSFTLALAYLQLPKEIPTPEEIEIPIKELKELPKEEKTQEIKEEVKSKSAETTKKILPYYSRLVKKKLWEGTETAKIAIILDDAGYSTNGFVKELLQIQAPLTFSILPGVKYSKEIATMAHEKGFEIMLHMPMEYCGNSKMTKEDELCRTNHNMNPYKYAILTGMSKEQVEEELENAINNIPYVVGINNHMGSKATADEVIMSYVLDKIKTRNLYFIDSVTTGLSVAYKVGKRKGVPTNKRSVFLDNINDVEYVKERISELIYMAKRDGYAIGIGHATKRATTEALVEMVPKLKEYGIKVVPASELVD
ncbi:MAG: divergent polysaccharide deacetylase family protein [bacterium]